MKADKMKVLINLRSYPVKETLSILLQDKTTKQNIRFATDSYAEKGPEYEAFRHITKGSILGLDACEIQPRVAKAKEEQSARTKKHAEVFTPSWVCNKMNNYCDEEWFGRKDVFNYETRDNHNWQATNGVIEFPTGKTWKDYVDSRRLEITCGEAPYIVSRYDTTTGEIIPVDQRIGILDRKMRIVNENTETSEEWLKWSTRAFQSVYGYEYQGDNLLIARINVLNSYVDYYEARFGCIPDAKNLRSMAHIIAWNFWQMDGLKGTVPYEKKFIGYQQMSLFSNENEEFVTEPIECIIRNWRSNISFTYNSMRKE